MSKAYIVAMSHLSDIQEELNFIGPRVRNEEEALEIKDRIRLRCNFAKYIISKYSSNMDVWIDADADFKEFRTKFPNA